MEDSIVQQLRDRAYAFKATDRLSERAADEIERLQRSITDWQLEADVHRKRAAAAVAEVRRLQNIVSGYTDGIAAGSESKTALTDEEREAIELFATLSWTSMRWSKVEKNAATLRKLLERLA